jgi:RNA polymerase sigma factor (sigma-70 family)
MRRRYDKKSSENNDFVVRKLIAMYEERIRKLIEKQLGDECLADETFDKIECCILQKFHQLENREHFHFWARKIAINICKNTKRDAAIKRRNREDYCRYYISRRLDQYLSPEERTISKEIRQKIYDAINSLPENDRNFFCLFVERGEESVSKFAKKYGLCRKNVERRFKKFVNSCKGN